MSVDAHSLYAKILETANLFLHKSKHFSVEILAQDDPTYEALSAMMERVSGILFILADDFDPMLCHKAVEYCGFMKQMGLAIKNQDQKKLSELADELGKRPFL